LHFRVIKYFTQSSRHSDLEFNLDEAKAPSSLVSQRSEPSSDSGMFYIGEVG